MTKPDWTDAKFKVIRPKGGWRLSFDWRNFLIISGVAVAVGLRTWLAGH